MKKIKRAVLSAWVTAQVLLVNAAATGNIAGSQIGVGMKNMLNDASSFLLVLCPLAGGVAAVYFIIRRGVADEQDGKMWTRRITIAIVCGVAGFLVSGAIKLIASYFV